MAAIQLCDAGLISEETKEEFNSYSTKRRATQFGWKANYDCAAKILELPRSSERLVADAYKAYGKGLIALPSVSFAEQVSIEEVIDSAGGPQRPSDNEHTGHSDIETDLDFPGHVKMLENDYERLWKHIRLFSGPSYTNQGGMAKNFGEYVLRPVLAAVP